MFTGSDGVAAMEHLRELTAQQVEIVALLDRGEALRSALEVLAREGDVAWVGEPDESGDAVLRHVLGDLTGDLRGLHVPPGLGLTGKVHQTARPCWVDDYFRAADITHTFDRQIQAEGVSRLLAVPVMREDRVLGVLAIGARREGRFGDRAVTRAREVADQAALAVTVAERARLAREAAVHEERNRLATELHDTVGALLFAIGSGVAGLAETAAGDPDMIARLDRLQHQARQASTALRDSLRALRASPTALALSVALQADCTGFSDRTGLPAELVILDDPPELPPSRTEVLVSAVREALLNVEKHAQASAVVVTVSRPPGGIAVAVTDDGRGLAPDHTPGLGLTTAAEAVARLGGSLRVVTDTAGGGTTFRTELPC